MIESLLSRTELLFVWLTHGAWQAGLLALVVLLITWLLRGRLHPRWRFALWMVVFARLAMPILPAAPWSLFGLLGGQEAKEIAGADVGRIVNPSDSSGDAVETSDSREPTSSALAAATPFAPGSLTEPLDGRFPPAGSEASALPPADLVPAVEAAAEPPPAELPWLRIAAVVWMLGVALLAARHVITLWRFRRERRSWQPVTWASLSETRIRVSERRDHVAQPAADAELFATLESCRREVRLRRPVRLALSRGNLGPATCGVLRPWVVLPGKLAESLSPAELRLVLLHELVHVRRLDVLWDRLATLITIVHWFHPVAWVARFLLRKDRELACDAAVLDRAGEQAAAPYGHVILKTVETLITPTPMPGLVGMFSRRPQSFLERRVRLIAAYRQSTWASLAAGAAVLVVFLLVGLTDAQTSSPSDVDRHSSSSAEEQSPSSSADGHVTDDASKDASQTAPGETAATPAGKAETLHYAARVTDKDTRRGIGGATVTIRLVLPGDFERKVERKVLREDKYTTDSEGRYRFAIPAEQAAAERLSLEFDAEHADYAPRSGSRFRLSVARKREKRGEKQFFENIELLPGKAITGHVKTPDGQPAAGVVVRSYSHRMGDPFNGVRGDARTQADGRFRLTVVTPGEAIIWIVPKAYAPLAYKVKEGQRGDLGTFNLKPGIVIKGRLLDAAGNLLPGLPVHAERVKAPEEEQLERIGDMIGRSAITDDQGRFTLLPLPPGEFRILPRETHYEPSDANDDDRRYDLPAVFQPTKQILKPGEPAGPLVLRAVPHVVIQAQHYDSRGQKIRRSPPTLSGKLGSEHVSVEGKASDDGRATILAARGLEQAELHLYIAWEGALRWRMNKDAPLSNLRRINLGTVTEDIAGIEIIHYASPVLTVGAVDKDKRPLKDFAARIVYAFGKSPLGPMTRQTTGGHVEMVKQEDGRFRSRGLLPDEMVTVIVNAAGHETKAETIHLAEGTTKELQIMLEAAEKPAKQADGIVVERAAGDWFLSVVDEDGRAIKGAEAMLHSHSDGWNPWRSAASLDYDCLFEKGTRYELVVRAPGYAPTIQAYTHGVDQPPSKVTLRKGTRVEMTLRTHDGRELPAEVEPMVFFEDYADRVRPMRQPSNKRGQKFDFNMTSLVRTAPGRYALSIPDDPRKVYVAIDHEGFLRAFEAGPFTTEQLKSGKLEIQLPKPAELEVTFGPGPLPAEAVPYKRVRLELMWHIPGSEGAMLTVAGSTVDGPTHRLAANDLAPGKYRVYAITAPEKPAADPEAPHPGAFRDSQVIMLEAGQARQMKLAYVPLDPNSLKGDRSAAIRIFEGGAAAAGQPFAISGTMRHFGQVRIREGKVPESGTIQLDGLAAGPGDGTSYSVEVNGKYLGHFALKDGDKTATFEFYVTPAQGDEAPDISLHDIFANSEVKLSSFRGQVVFLEFWATWCGPCQPAMAKLNTLAQEQKDAWKGKVAVLGLSIDDSPARAEQHARQRGWTAVRHFWAGEGGFTSDPGRKYALHGVPEALLIDQKGNIVWRGHPSKIDLVAEVAKLGPAKPVAEKPE